MYVKFKSCTHGFYDNSRYSYYYFGVKKDIYIGIVHKKQVRILVCITLCVCAITELNEVNVSWNTGKHLRTQCSAYQYLSLFPVLFPQSLKSYMKNIL